MLLAPIVRRLAAASVIATAASSAAFAQSLTLNGTNIVDVPGGTGLNFALNGDPNNGLFLLACNKQRKKS